MTSPPKGMRKDEDDACNQQVQSLVDKYKDDVIVQQSCIASWRSMKAKQSSPEKLRSAATSAPQWPRLSSRTASQMRWIAETWPWEPSSMRIPATESGEVIPRTLRFLISRLSKWSAGEKGG